MYSGIGMISFSREYIQVYKSCAVGHKNLHFNK